MSDVKDFKLPDLGEGLEEGEIVKWLVDVGDVVVLNQEIVEVETAKAVVAVPVPFAGTIIERTGEPGETLEVGTVICRIDTSGGAAPAGGGGGDDTRADAEQGDLLSEVGQGAGGNTGLDADAEPQPLVGYGQKEGGRRRRRGGGAAAAGAAAAVTEAVKPLAKPPVRKLAKDLGVDLAAIAPGSGEGGVITREDVRAAADGGARAAAPAAAAPAAPAQQPAASAAAPAAAAATPVFASAGAGEKAVPGFRGRTPGEVEKVAGIRKRIVEKMETSRREIPEATCSREADLTELWELRRKLTDAAREDGFDVKITPFALILRAVVLGLRRFPTINATIDREAGEIRLHQHVNLGFAADTDRGLIVPNIKDAHTKSTLQIAMELNELATKARNGQVSAAELTGGTFTVSNYGAFGNDDGNPIINHPEGAILGVGAIREKPWVVDGELAVRRVCTFSLAFDHRVSDGGEAGRFVTYVGDLCENPGRILLHA